MEIKIKEAINLDKSILITGEKACLENVKAAKNANSPIFLEIDYYALNLNQTLYGKTKRESIEIQKQNCKKFKIIYKLTKKALRLLKNTNFDGTLYVKNLSAKKNNNDFMLVSMLGISFAKPQNKFMLAYEAACDYLDMENSLNKMCDFQDNKCTKHREKGVEKNTGCCASFCKLRESGKVCPHKNLSCKVFMCDYLINEKGYYFTPNTIPVLRRYFTWFERIACFGLLCRTEKKVLGQLRGIRVLEALYILLISTIIIVLAL